MAGLNIQIEWKTRLCKVGERLGYFHGWERYINERSEPARSQWLFMGGNWNGGVCSFRNRMVGIVEFSDGVRRVDPSEIVFCDEENQMLSEMEKMRKEREANDQN